MKKNLQILTEEQLHKRFHYMYFILAVCAIGILIFYVFQAGMMLLLPNVGHEAYSEKFVGHNYCGTFFIEISDKDFVSEEAFNKFKAYETPVAVTISNVVLSAGAIIGLILVLRRADKGRLYSKGSSVFLLSAAFFFFANSLLMELLVITKQNEVRQFYKGFLATNTYYFQIHTALAVPFILFCAALLLNRSELKIKKIPARNNGRLLRISAISLVAVGGGFMLIRFATRIGELVELFEKNGKDMAVRIPFYSELIDLPSSAAASAEEYMKLVIFRFVKDMPVFIASALCIFLLAKLLFSYAADKINTAQNAKYIKVMIIALAISSVLFNGLGIIEVLMLNNSFTGSYGNAYYTIGIRGNCEPLVYAVCLYTLGLFEKAYTVKKPSFIPTKKAAEKAASQAE